MITLSGNNENYKQQMKKKRKILAVFIIFKDSWVGLCPKKQFNFIDNKKQQRRKLFLNGYTVPHYFTPNKINNQKYSMISFIPMVLYHEFKFFFNLFFLLIALAQLVPFLRVGFLFTYLAPLAFVLFITMLKEAFDDFQRLRRDKEMNETKFEILTIHGFKPTNSKDMKVGQIVKVYQNQRIPADLLLLYTTEKTGSVFLRTDQLDGETDWKLRKALQVTQRCHPPESIIHYSGYLVAMPPNDQIYDFKGYFQHDFVGQEREPLSLENTLWTNTVLASSGFILGMILYTGKETRAQMNSKMPRSKIGLLDQEINFLSKVLFILMLILSGLIILFDGFVGSWYFKYFRFVLLLASIIPISLRVNLDLAKIYYSYCISKDDKIVNTIARNSSIPEELGRIQFLLSDKTGTLTQNDMIFKKVEMEYAQFSIDSMHYLRELLKLSCKESTGPCGDVKLTVEEVSPLKESKKKKAKKQTTVKKQRDQHYIVRDLLLALNLCHNVTPTYPDDKNPQYKEYQASSPDEIALVKFADSLDMNLISREELYVKINNAAGVDEEYDILANFPFSSETKRMGIILKHRETNKIIFYLKGAETVMEKKIKPNQRANLLESCERLAMEGLRTLVISQKILTDKQYEEFDLRYKKARASLNKREEMIKEAVESIEENMEFLGVTGVEDKLQDDVLTTIETLRSAGIQIWMLTGDKVETAKCIAISAGLKSNRQQVFEIKASVQQGFSLEQSIYQRIEDFEKKITNCMLIIDGEVLSVILSIPRLETRFFEVTKGAPSVCICRCSPTQKSIVAKKIQQYTNKRIACVGDGGNDVAMIQVADVGIGIVGKEGMQASLAADFSILKFNYLRHLILWHGRLSYKRSAVLSQFVIHRGLIISIIQAVFTIIFYFVSVPIYNGYLMMGYTTIYTSLPVFSLVLDEDVGLESVMKFPPLYKSMQKGRSLNLKTFMIWVWKSIYQGTAIMLCTILLFMDSFVNIVSITFTALIFIETLNVLTEVHRVKFKMVVSIIFTIAIYIGSIMLLHNYFDTSYITMIFLAKVMIITGVCWLPIHILKMLIERIDPSEERKVNNSS